MKRLGPSSGPAATIRQLQRALDILTTHAAAEDVIRARAETLLAYLEHVPLAILIADNQARYVDANHAASVLTRYARAELIGLALWDLTPTPRRTLGRRLWRDFLRRGRMTGRYDLRRKNGTFVRANYFAVGNVLPGVHVSVLAPAPDRMGRSARQRGSRP
jgi:PAS domain S-box-containing protein